MRRQRPRGATTQDSILSAALAIVDEVGLDALTIRAVAKLVGAPPMSLYTHFASKDELIDLMYSELARRLYADAQRPTWQEELLTLCRLVRAILVALPRWIPLLSRPAPPTTVPPRERLFSLMTKDGMSADEALAAVSSAVLLSIGHVLVEVTFRGSDGESSVAKRFERIRAWVETGEDPLALQRPVTRSAFTTLRRLDLEDNFTLTVRTFIAGLEAKRAP
jgi:AcrR family transcriptional regulator